MIKAVFFDLYHTLVKYNPPREEVGAAVLNSFGINIEPESLRRPMIIADEYFNMENTRSPMSKRTREERLAAFTRYQEVMLKEAGVEVSPKLVAAIIGSWQKSDFKLVLFDDVVPVLANLRKRGLVLGLISNVDRDVIPLLEELGLARLLDVTVTSLDTGFTKPQPEIFHEAVIRAEVKVEEAVFVGDQYQIDVVGAEKAGLTGVLIDRGGYFKDIGDCLYIRSLHQLAEQLPQ